MTFFSGRLGADTDRLTEDGESLSNIFLKNSTSDEIKMQSIFCPI